ncbi:MAG: helix-turn-helix domain-containing protein [Muribaculaceae bacterium]|nr:helix-turn-helix domain-containing protein [Muribaculaceae bacterium]
MELQQQLGKAIRAIRTKQGLSQEKLALEAGVDRRYMSDIENGARNVSLNVIERISKGLAISTSYLLKCAEEYSSSALTLEELKQYLHERGCDDTVFLEHPDYITAVVGISEDERLVYSYTGMLEFLIANEGMTYEDACDWIDFNLIRALPYMGENAPIITFDILT